MALFKRIAQDPREGPGKTKDCPICKGKGKMPKDLRDTFKRNLPNAKPLGPKTPCPTCAGTGRLHK